MTRHRTAIGNVTTRTRRTSMLGILLFLASAMLGAHGGGLDSNGGHYNRKTGEYHCHRCPCGCSPSGGQEARPQPTKPRAESEAARGGNPNTRVWVNTSSAVYHCPGTRWYGTTKSGAYMTQGAAQRQGNRPAYGNTCP